MISNIPRLITLDAARGYYSINLQLTWEGQSSNFDMAGQVPMLGLGIGYSILDTFNIASVQGNVSGLTIKTITGTVRFGNDEDVVGTPPGPLFILVSDTQQCVAVTQNTNGGGFSGTGGTGPIIAGIGGSGWFSFTVPLITNGGDIQFMRLPNINPSAFHGYANLNLLTFDFPALRLNY